MKVFRTIRRSLPVLAAIGTAIVLSGCNRGIGCPGQMDLGQTVIDGIVQVAGYFIGL